ncbi:MAG: gluconeogenesis factor YvcK family protein [Ardenticatenaceae bacterium]
MQKVIEKIKVFLPGLGLKRWLVVIFFGLLHLAIGTTLWLANLLRSIQQHPLYNLLTLGFLSRFSRGMAFFGVGSVLTYYGWQELSRSIMRVMLPEQPEAGLGQVLMQRQRAVRGRRVVVMGSDPGVSPILASLGLLKEDVRVDLILTATEPGYRVQQLQKKFGLSGEQVIYPTKDDATLYAVLSDGRLLEGPATINRFTDGKVDDLFLSRNIRRVQVWESHQNGKGMASKLRDYMPNVSESALDALEQAELIILAPGLIYTQMLPNLTMPRMAQAVQESQAKKVYVANLMTEPGRTNGWSVADHIQTIDQMSGITIDYALVHEGEISKAMLEQYLNEGADVVSPKPTKNDDGMTELIFLDTGEKTQIIKDAVIISDDLVTERPQVVTIHRGGDTILREMPVVRHDPEKLAPIFKELLAQRM